MDEAKYRKLFVEEACEHLEELGRALLALEKDPRHREALDAVFRMAHSIKGMAASLGYDTISELAHRLEDCIDAARAGGGVDTGGGTTARLFRATAELERLVAAVERGEAPPPADPLLLDELAGTRGPAEDPPKKAHRDS